MDSKFEMFVKKINEKVTNFRILSAKESTKIIGGCGCGPQCKCGPGCGCDPGCGTPKRPKKHLGFGVA